MPAARRYVVDPDDPRAPSQELWDQMTPAEHEEVVASLPSEFEASEACPPEGDAHYDAVNRTREMLRGYYRKLRRRIYIGNNLPVYYPGQSMFSPDVIAVLDVEDHDRLSWIVAKEERGLDLAIEILHSGRRIKDCEHNVDKYAALGIREYFVFDALGLLLRGYRLPSPEARQYQRLVPQAGVYSSEVLGLDVGVEGTRLRFLAGSAALPDAQELIARLDAALASVREMAAQEAQRAEQEAQRAEQEAQRAEQEAQRADAEARARAELEIKVAALQAELDALRGR